MFDTVRFRLTQPLPLLRPFHLDSTNLGPPWSSVQSLGTIQSDPGDPSSFVRASGHLHTHSRSGIRLFIYDNRVHWGELSLPRLLHPNNSYLMLDQSHTDQAIRQLELTLESLVESAVSPSHFFLFTRIDLALQIRLGVPVSDFLHTAQHLRHRRVRKGYQSHRESAQMTGVTIGKRTGSLRIQFYDKGRQMKCAPNNVLRIEITLTKGLLKELLGPQSDQFPRALDHSRAYSAFRSVILDFNTSRTEVTSIESKTDYWGALLTLTNENGLRFPDGRTPTEVLQTVYGLQTARKYIRQATENTFKSIDVDFATEFPEEWPPPNLVEFIPNELDSYSVAQQVSRRRVIPNN
ncbi:MAG: hypothetical protein ACI8UO_004137 [Verrucomicrobiales bacterium]|jgi:hypothetical protein